MLLIGRKDGIWFNNMEVIDSLGKNFSGMAELMAWSEHFKRNGKKKIEELQTPTTTSYLILLVPTHYLFTCYYTMSDLSLTLVKTIPFSCTVDSVFTNLFKNTDLGNLPSSYIINYFLSTASFPSAYKHADVSH